MHKRVFKRNDNKELFLYGNNQHDEPSTKELEQLLLQNHICDGILQDMNGLLIQLVELIALLFLQKNIVLCVPQEI